jgi:hypothetical protein
MKSYEFDEAVALTEGESGWSATVPEGWDINGNANGGYVIALGANVLRAVSGRAHPLTMTAHYLAPVTAGPVTFTTEVVKQGKRFATMTGSIRRGDRELIRLLGAFGDLEPDMEQEYVQGSPPELPPIEECVRRTPVGGSAVMGLANRLNLMLHPDDAAALDERPTGSGLSRGYFTFADGRPVDTLALLLAADAFPPAVFNVQGLLRGWVPTVEFTVHVRGIPAPGPVRGRFETRFVSGGVLHEDGELWDSAGNLVAISRQYGLLARS